MTSWQCRHCGERVFGFEGERGVPVGTCRHCGESYNLSSGFDRKIRARYLYEQALAEEDDTPKPRIYADDDVDMFYFIEKSMNRSAYDRCSHTITRRRCTFREAKEYALGLSKSDKHWDTIILQAHFETLAFFRDGNEYGLYCAIAQFTRTENGKVGTTRIRFEAYSPEKAIQSAEEYIEHERNGSSDEWRGWKLKYGPITDSHVEGPYDKEQYYQMMKEKAAEQRAERLARIEARITAEVGVSPRE